MADLKLSFAIEPYDRVLPLISGEVKPEGITLDYMGAGEGAMLFYYQIKFQRYDISEMSLSSFLRMRSIGWPYRIIPVFHNRTFSYTTIHCRVGSGIRQGHPEDLKGKRVSIADYQMSLGLWARGILQMEFGVKPEDIVWYQERGEHFSHTGASVEAGRPIPKNVELHYAKMNRYTMYQRGELDADISNFLDTGARVSRVGLRRAEPAENPDTVTLFPDPRQEAIRFFKKTGIYPPNHVTVIRESILQEHPWVAISLMEAFEESKRLAIQRLHKLPPSLMIFGQFYLKELDETFGPDPYAYGIKANAKAFDMAQTFSVQQGLTERKQPLDEIYAREAIYREEAQ